MKIGSDGSLTLDDEDVLEDALEEDAEAVINIFSGTNGLANQLENLIEQFIGTGATIDDSVSAISDRTKTINTQISRFESRSKIQENMLRQKFTELERALVLLNSQQILLQKLGFSTLYTSQYPFTGFTSQTQSLLNF